MPSKKLAKIEPSAYAILDPAQMTDAIEVVAENLGSGGVQIGQFDRITIPPGGGLAFNVATEDGVKPFQTLTGIIVLAPEQKAYWDKPMEENPGSAPACFSPDCQYGTGDPAGTGQVSNKNLCAVCPHNDWGSDPTGGKGKACRDLRPLFVLQAGDFLPVIVQTSRMSLKRVTSYFTLLARKGIPYFGVVTEIGLVQAKNDAGIVYSELTFKMTEMIDKEKRTAMKQYQEILKVHATAPPADADVNGAPAPETQEPDYNPFEEDEDGVNAERDAIVTNPGTGSIIDG